MLFKHKIGIRFCSLIVFSVPMLISGVIALFTESALPVIVLIVGMVVGFIPIVKAQQKYNGGMF